MPFSLIYTFNKDTKFYGFNYNRLKFVKDPDEEHNATTKNYVDRVIKTFAQALFEYLSNKKQGDTKENYIKNWTEILKSF